MSLALAQLLPEFHLPKQRQKILAEHPPKKGALEHDQSVIDAARQEGYRQGLQEAQAEMVLRHAAELEELQAIHQAELEAQASRLAVGVAQAVPEAIAARAEGLLNQLAGDLVAVLAPIVEENARQKMVAALIEEIRSALDIGQAEKIVVTGPEIWLDAMRATLGSDLPTVEFRESDTVDIDVVIDQTRLSSRFASLGANLREAMS